MRDFRKIQVWERSHQFALQVYKITSTFPKIEKAVQLNSKKSKV